MMGMTLDKYISIIDDYCEDIEGNPSYYFCQVYKDPDQEEEYDSFLIRKSDLCGVTDYDNAMKFAVNRVKEDEDFMKEVFGHIKEEDMER